MVEKLDLHPKARVLRHCTAVKSNCIIADGTELSTNSLTASLLQSQRQVFDTCKTLDFGLLPAEQARRTVNPSTRSGNSAATAGFGHVTPPPSRITSREDLELSPLSPNVCTERGPSKYHKNRTTEITASPLSTTSRLPFRSQRRHLQENVALSYEPFMQGYAKSLRDCGVVSHSNTFS